MLILSPVKIFIYERIFFFLGLSDSTQAIIGTLSGFSTAMVYAFTSKPWQMYLGMSVGLFVDVVSPTIRSILSKSAPAEDMGKKI